MTLDNQGLGELGTRPQKRGLSQELKGKGLSPKRPVAIGDLPELPAEDRELEDQGERLKENGLTFSQMFEETQKGAKFQEGEVVEGQVVHVDPEFVTIDIGYKSEGQISASEFYDNRGELMVAEGDHILVYIEKVEDDDGRLILSKEKADVLRAWDEI